MVSILGFEREGWKNTNNRQTTSPKKIRPRCYAKSPTVQDTFQPILGLISCAGMTGRWGLLPHAQNTCLVSFKRSVEAFWRHLLYVIPHLTYSTCYACQHCINLKDLAIYLSRRIGEVARITLSAASMFDLTAGITVFCKLEVGGEQISVDRYCKVVTMQLTFSGSKLVCNVDIYEH